MPVVDLLPITLANIVHLLMTQRRLEDGVLVIRIRHVMIEHFPQVPCLLLLCLMLRNLKVIVWPENTLVISHFFLYLLSVKLT